MPAAKWPCWWFRYLRSFFFLFFFWQLNLIFFLYTCALYLSTFCQCGKLIWCSTWFIRPCAQVRIHLQCQQPLLDGIVHLFALAAEFKFFLFLFNPRGQKSGPWHQIQRVNAHMQACSPITINHISHADNQLFTTWGRLFSSPLLARAIPLTLALSVHDACYPNRLTLGCPGRP